MGLFWLRMPKTRFDLLKRSMFKASLCSYPSDGPINGSGRFHLASVLGAVRRRLYLDLDPGFVQIWQEQHGVDMNLRGHEVHITVGLNLGAPDRPLPTCGIQWHTTLPPVVLDEWSPTAPPGNAYITVGDWRGYSDLDSAVDTLSRVESDYATYAATARALSREHLDSDRVLSRLLRLVGL